MGDDMDFCHDCKRYTQVVSDHCTGDTICTECGLVLEARCIEETHEWRTFGDDSRDNDPIRVGEARNPLIENVGLETFISNTKGTKKDGNQPSSIKRWQNKAGLKPGRSLTQGFRNIDAMADRLELLAIVKNRANEIYKKVVDAQLRRRNQDAIVAACLYIACRLEGQSRTLKEIHTVADGSTPSEIAKTVKCIEQFRIEVKPIEGGTIRPVDHLRRFGNYLGMKYPEIKAGEDAARMVEEFDIRRSPISIAAAVIYMITQFSTEKKLLKDISRATTVAESTIKNTYKDLYPFASRMIPSLKEEDLKKLCSH